MNPTIEVTETDHVPRDARVCHYDELTGEAKHALPDAVEHGTATVRMRTAETFSRIDVIKFTSYLRVTIRDLDPASESGRVPTKAPGTSHTEPPRTGDAAAPDDPLPESR